MASYALESAVIWLHKYSLSNMQEVCVRVEICLTI